MDPLIPGVDPESIADWKILMRISASENSVVYLGSRGIEGAEEAAIKVISRNLSSDSTALERLQIEVDALKQLNNPNIAKLLDFDLDATPAWIATEYLSRKSLETKLRQDRTPVTGMAWWELARSIFSGLRAMHSINITHRDIKPANIMVDNDVIKIIDFGISYVPGHTTLVMKDSLQFEGSRPFAAPENFNNKYTPKMDVFSAAVTLAYAAKLKSIWNDSDYETLSESIVKGKPDLTGLKAEQIELLSPLLDKFASQRPSSEATLNKILEYIEHFANVNAPRPAPLKGSTWFYRLSKKRNFKAAVILLLLALTATSFAVRDPEVVYLREDVPSNPSTANSSGTNLEQSNNLPAPSTSTNNQNINIELERCLNLTKTDFKSALKSCLTAAESGNGMANYQVGYIYEQYFKDSKKARPFFEKAIALGYIDGYVGIAADLIAKKKYKEAIIELLKAENAGSRNSSNLIGLAYEKLGDLDSALKYYLKSSNYGEVLSSYNAGMIYYTRKQFDNAIKYFTIAGNKNDAPSMYQLGVIYREVKNDLTSSCTWFKRGLDASDSRSQQAWKDFCNEDFKVTAGEASDVKFFSLNEAPFLGGSMYHFIWVGSTEKLLDFTGIQVRPKGRTDVPWIQVPHRLQKRSEATYALVDELFLNIATKQSNICWDFRTVKEVQGKLNTIWTYLPASGCT